MAKGWTLTSSRSLRLLGSKSYSQGQGMVADASELGEEDVWAVVNREDRSSEEWSPRTSVESNGSTELRREDHCHRHRAAVGGLSLAFDERGGRTTSSRIVHQFRSQEVAASPHGCHMASSAPVNIPDWAKIYRVDSVDSLHDLDDGGDEQDSEMVPPHEYLGRKMTANSVFVGVGRTLKGRDMSRVRDVVWSQTGFDG